MRLIDADALLQKFPEWAKDMTISVERVREWILEQPTHHTADNSKMVCEDCISRQAAIEVICAECAVANQETCATRLAGESWCPEVYALQNIPTVTPKMRTGKWIDVMVGEMPAQACDQCKTFYPLAYTGGGHRFCPNCGAKMEADNGETL